MWTFQLNRENPTEDGDWTTVRVYPDLLENTNFSSKETVLLCMLANDEWGFYTFLLTIDVVSIFNINLVIKYGVILGFNLKLLNDTWCWYFYMYTVFSWYGFSRVSVMSFVHNQNVSLLLSFMNSPYIIKYVFPRYPLLVYDLLFHLKGNNFSLCWSSSF